LKKLYFEDSLIYNKYKASK